MKVDAWRISRKDECEERLLLLSSSAVSGTVQVDGRLHIAIYAVDEDVVSGEEISLDLKIEDNCFSLCARFLCLRPVADPGGGQLGAGAPPKLFNLCWRPWQL